MAQQQDTTVHLLADEGILQTFSSKAAAHPPFGNSMDCVVVEPNQRLALEITIGKDFELQEGNCARVELFGDGIKLAQGCITKSDLQKEDPVSWILMDKGMVNVPLANKKKEWRLLDPILVADLKDLQHPSDKAAPLSEDEEAELSLVRVDIRRCEHAPMEQAKKSFFKRYNPKHHSTARVDGCLHEGTPEHKTQQRFINMKEGKPGHAPLCTMCEPVDREEEITSYVWRLCHDGQFSPDADTTRARTRSPLPDYQSDSSSLQIVEEQETSAVFMERQLEKSVVEEAKYQAAINNAVDVDARSRLRFSSEEFLPRPKNVKGEHESEEETPARQTPLQTEVIVIEDDGEPAPSRADQLSLDLLEQRIFSETSQSISGRHPSSEPREQQCTKEAASSGAGAIVPFVPGLALTRRDLEIAGLAMEAHGAQQGFAQQAPPEKRPEQYQTAQDAPSTGQTPGPEAQEEEDEEEDILAEEDMEILGIRTSSARDLVQIQERVARIAQDALMRVDTLRSDALALVETARADFAALAAARRELEERAVTEVAAKKRKREEEAMDDLADNVSNLGTGQRKTKQAKTGK